MNKRNAHLYLPLIQALSEGKTIQKKGYLEERWTDIRSPTFNTPPENYRVKPEPMRVWVNFYKGGYTGAHSSVEDAEKCAACSCDRVAVPFVEVVE